MLLTVPTIATPTVEFMHSLSVGLETHIEYDNHNDNGISIKLPVHITISEYAVTEVKRSSINLLELRHPCG